MRWKRTRLGFSQTDVNNQYSYSYVNGAKRNSHCVADSKVAYGHKITVFVILEKKQFMAAREKIIEYKCTNLRLPLYYILIDL